LPEKLVLDTSVLVEYIIAGSPYRKTVAELFSRAERGALEPYINTVTLAETLYIAARIYRAAGVENSNKEAENFVTWVTSRINIVDVDVRLSKSAGELKKKLGIALPDCLVIALANRIGGKALFKKVEDEMVNVLDELRRLGVVFLESDYSLKQESQ